MPFNNDLLLSMCVRMCGGLLHGNGLRKVLIFAAHSQRLITNCTSLAAEVIQRWLTGSRTRGVLYFKYQLAASALPGNVRDYLKLVQSIHHYKGQSLHCWLVIVHTCQLKLPGEHHIEQAVIKNRGRRERESTRIVKNRGKDGNFFSFTLFFKGEENTFLAMCAWI